MKTFEGLTRETFLRDSALREAFIVEELKPFLIKEGDELIYTHQLKSRLAEINDFKQRVKASFDEIRCSLNMICYEKGMSEKTSELWSLIFKYYKELGLED